jgi:hypothetical protein
MAIHTVNCRQKIEGTGWRHRPLRVGRRREAARDGPYFETVSVGHTSEADLQREQVSGGDP